VKFWKRNGNDPDIEDIWRSEIRQLQRLAAVPLAEDLFVPMFAHGEDESGFTIVVNPGQGAPLEVFRRSRHQPDVISQPRLPRNKRLIWANGLRIAKALDLLHSQGIIHRNVDPWAIVTSFTDEADFRLTGFEWSMRIASFDRPTTSRKKRPAEEVASFRQDWIKFGLLLTQLLAAPPDRITNLALLPSEIADHITAAEGRALRSILGLDDPGRLDGGMICDRIEEVIAGMEAQAAGTERKLALAVRLDRDSALSAAIRRASDNETDIADVAAQLRFVVDDLSEEPYLIRADNRLALAGRYLTYTLTQYRQPHSNEPASWEFAICDRANLKHPSAPGPSVRIEPNMLDVVDSREAAERFPRRRSRVARWDTFLNLLDPQARAKTRLERKHQAFALLSILEMAYAAADIFPVDVLPGSAVNSLETHAVRLSPRQDPERTALSAALRLEPPAARLRKMLESDDLPSDEGWALSESGSLGDRNIDTEWRFMDTGGGDAPQFLNFEGAEATRIRGAAFLAPSEMHGQIAQFRRRVKALKALRDHTELLRMFVDPRFRMDDSRDRVEKDSRYKALDPSKQLALTEILTTVPLFLLQGPPGVGKTFLVGDLVRRRFQDEPTTRLLLTAQSNAAIDHLMGEVLGLFPSESQPVMVRARPADDDPSDTDLEIDR
jgi:hypothetical protein